MTVTIGLDTATLGRVRMAGSPLWEALSSITLLARHGQEAPWPYTGWSRYVAAGLHRLAGNSAVELVAEMPDGKLPAFLTLVPAGPGQTIHRQLGDLVGTPASVLEAQLDHQYGRHLPAPLARFAADPAAALAEFAAELAVYWEIALEPYWPVIRAAIDTELMLRAQILAAKGAEAMLAGLHRRIVYADGRIEIAGATDGQVALDGGWLVVVPMMFARGAPIISAGSATGFSYPARGAAALSHGSSDEVGVGDRLGILLGLRRAELLRALREPVTTTALAAALGLAVSTVSEHLSVLLAADVVARRRSGGKVLYLVTAAGQAVVDQLGGAGPEPMGTNSA